MLDLMDTPLSPDLNAAIAPMQTPETLNADTALAENKEKAFKARQLVLFTNIAELNVLWTRIKVYRKEHRLKTTGDAILELVKKALQ